MLLFWSTTSAPSLAAWRHLVAPLTAQAALCLSQRREGGRWRESQLDRPGLTLALQTLQQDADSGGPEVNRGTQARGGADGGGARRPLSDWDRAGHRAGRGPRMIPRYPRAVMMVIHREHRFLRSPTHCTTTPQPSESRCRGCCSPPSEPETGIPDRCSSRTTG